ADSSEISQAGEARYANLGDSLPRTECLADVIDRLLPYWYDILLPELSAGKTVLVAAHAHSLRALAMHLDGISDAVITGLNIQTRTPLHYELTEDFTPVRPGGTYLDPAAAEAAIGQVANQGR